MTVEFFASSHNGSSTAYREAQVFHPHKDQEGPAGAVAAQFMGAAQGDYAGDVTPAYAYDILKAEADAVLVDVRTKAEWGFVGVPDLSDIAKMAGFIEWLTYPEMAPNPAFLTELERFVEGNEQRAVFFLCRSGQRSQNAAIAATAQGFTRAYNIEGGFEGALDNDRHRGRQSGWKAAGLPWAQT
jgi:rhodanese-related sulfurtransferase